MLIISTFSQNAEMYDAYVISKKEIQKGLSFRNWLWKGDSLHYLSNFLLKNKEPFVFIANEIWGSNLLL